MFYIGMNQVLSFLVNTSVKLNYLLQSAKVPQIKFCLVFN